MAHPTEAAVLLVEDDEVLSARVVAEHRAWAVRTDALRDRRLKKIEPAADR
ncbi:MAG: hypothetical protein AABZ30_10010 [Myxococcota bacterium]